MNQNEINNGNVNNSSVNNAVDPRTVNAEVIGELRKDKIGRPILVLEIFGLFIIVLIALPIVTSMLNDENSALYQLIYGDVGEVISPETPTPTSEFLDGSVEQPLVSTTAMNFENLIMKDFSLSGGTINCTMYSYNDLLNLDETEYYLEIYSNSNNLLAAIKLTGTLDYQETQVALTANDLNFNSNYSYFGKVVEMTKDDYPAIELATDESGIGGFTCTKDNRTLEYTFMNNYLINIRDTVHVTFDSAATDEYLNLKSSYDSKKALLGDLATVEEVADGFTYSANINLETPGFTYPETLVDYEYYDLDTEAKVVHYALEGKGYDCE